MVGAVEKQEDGRDENEAKTRTIELAQKRPALQQMIRAPCWSLISIKFSFQYSLCASSEAEKVTSVAEQCFGCIREV